MEYLYQHKILSLSTVRLTCVPNNKQPSKQAKKKRGTSVEHIFKTAHISSITWKDNKAVFITFNIL